MLFDSTPPELGAGGWSFVVAALDNNQFAGCPLVLEDNFPLLPPRLPCGSIAFGARLRIVFCTEKRRECANCARLQVKDLAAKWILRTVPTRHCAAGKHECSINAHCKVSLWAAAMCRREGEGASDVCGTTSPRLGRPRLRRKPAEALRRGALNEKRQLQRCGDRVAEVNTRNRSRLLRRTCQALHKFGRRLHTEVKRVAGQLLTSRRASIASPLARASLARKR